MNNLRKLFGGIKMTWPKVILFSVVVAFITAACLIFPVLAKTPLVEMGVGYECWFIFAIFVISNCKSTLDAGLKTFVFFLISQPLIFLLQQPFAEINLLKTYYLPWFIITLLTFPGAMLAYQVKRDKIYSAFILGVAGLYLGGLMGGFGLVGYIMEGNIPYVLYSAFFAVAAILLGFIFFRKKSVLITYLIIVLVAMIGFGGLSFVRNNGKGSMDYDIVEEGSWTLGEYGSADMSLRMVDEDTIHIEYNRNSYANLTLQNEDGEVLYINIEVKKGNVEITENRPD